MNEISASTSVQSICQLTSEAASEGALEQTAESTEPCRSALQHEGVVQSRSLESLHTIKDSYRTKRWAALHILWAFSLLWGLPTLACGSFAPRPTPTPTSPPAAAPADANPILLEPTPTVALITVIDTPVPVVALPLPTDTPAVVANGLAVGNKALISAPAGLNLRQQPSSAATLLTRLATGIQVTIIEGPVNAENFTWWRVDDGKGSNGWVAERNAQTVFLAPIGGVAQSTTNQPEALPSVGGGINPNAKPVNRPPQIGERVEVTMPSAGQLTIRDQPGKNATVITRVDSGKRFLVQAGPQFADNYQWYQIISEDGTIRGWAAGGDSRGRWLSPLE